MIDDITKGILKQAPNSPLELYKQVIIILAAAYGFISPFIKDFKRESSLIARFEKELFTFITTGSLYAYFKPIFTLYHFADKNDFNLYNNPLVFCLNFFILSFIRNYTNFTKDGQ